MSEVAKKIFRNVSNSECGITVCHPEKASKVHSEDSLLIIINSTNKRE